MKPLLPTLLTILIAATFLRTTPPTSSRQPAQPPPPPIASGRAQAPPSSRDPHSPPDPTRPTADTPSPTPPTLTTPTALSEDPIRTFNAWLDQHQASFLNPDATVSLPLGLELAHARRHALKTLIQTNPDQALAAAVPAQLRSQLPPALADLLETRVLGLGDLTVIYAKPPDGQPCTTVPITRFAQLDGAFYYVHPSTRRPLDQSQTQTAVVGIAVDDQLALASQPFPIFDPTEVPAFFRTPDGQWIWAGGGTGGTGTPSPINPSTDTQGELRFLFMRVRFADDSPTTEPSTDARVHQDLDAVMSAYAEMSYGTLQGRYAFTPTLTLPKPRSGYLNGWSDLNGMTALLNDAKTAAGAIVENGQRPYLPANFNLFAARWNGEPGGCCSYGGGGNAWIRWDGPGVLVHEWGHALGLPHANFWNPNTDDPIGPGAHEEYGNHLDAMGSGDTRHFSAQFKAQLLWLPSTHYWSVTNSGVFRIASHDQPLLNPSLRYAAEIQRPGHDAFRYWLEYRAHTLSGPEAAVATNALLVLRTQGNQLLDLTPGTSPGKQDGPLTIGRTYSDHRAGIHVTPIARGAASHPYLDVAIQLEDGRPNHPPVNVLSASTLTPSPGLSVQLSCSAHDPDGDPLAYSWDFGDGTLSLNNLPNQAKIYSTAGVYVARCTISDRRGGSAIDSLTLRVGTPGEYYISGRILTPDGRPVPQAMIRDGSGRLAWSGSDGTYTLGRLPAGTHILTAVRQRQTLSPPYAAISVPPSLNGIDFEDPSTSGPGRGLRREIWRNLAGSTVAHLTGSSRYPHNPSESEHIADAFEGPTDWADNYGARYRGFFIPPLSGGYVFYIASDDASDLRLSRDHHPANALRIASVSGWTSERAWTANSSQRSSTLQLAAGQPYYIEVLHKEGGGGDHLAVGVDLPNGSQERPIPFHRLQPFTTNSIPDPALVQVAASTPQTTEGGQPGAFSFTRTGPTHSPLDVFFLLRGNASYNSDYVGTGLRLAIPANTATVTLPIHPIDDATSEPPEAITLHLLDGPGYVAVTPASATITLLDNDGQATVTILATTPIAPRNASRPGRVTIRRTGAPTNPLTVNLTFAGSAINGLDYDPIPNQCVLPAGAGELDLPIRPLPAPNLAAPKNAQISIAAGPGYTVAAPASASVTITQPGPGFALLRESWDNLSAGTLAALTNDARFPRNPSQREYLTAVFEGPRDTADNYGTRYTALFVPPTTGNYFFSIASDDGGELYVGTNALPSSRRRVAWVNGWVPFRSWTSQANQRSSALPLVAGQRYYLEALHAEGSGGDHLSVGVHMPNGLSELPLTTQWLEPYATNRPLVLLLATIPVASELGTAAQFTLRRTGEPTNALPIAVALSGTAQLGLDYTLSVQPDAIVLPEGQNALHLTVNAVPDPSPEGPESVTLTLLPNPAYSLGYADTATVHIAADPPTATLTRLEPTAHETGPIPATFRLTLSQPAFGPTLLRYSTGGSAAPEDFPALTGQVSLPPGQTTALITALPAPDPFLESTESLILTLLPHAGYAVLAPNPAEALVLDGTPGSIPNPWTFHPIGHPNPGGGVQPLPQGFAIQGAGDGASSTTDQLHFLAQDLPIESAITVALATQPAPDLLAAAGLMLRASLAPDAPFVFFGHSAQHGLFFSHRAQTGAAPSQFFNLAPLPRPWLRLVRSHHSITAWSSDNAIDWIRGPTVAFPELPAFAPEGLAVWSRHPRALHTATFSPVLLHTPFSLSAIPNQHAPAGSPIGPLTFRFAPNTTDTTLVRLTADTSNPAILAASGVQFDGTGLERTLTLTPSLPDHGLAYVTVHASDGIYQSSIRFVATWGNTAFLAGDINPQTKELQLTWPPSLASASLWATPNLTPPVTWHRVTNAPVLHEGTLRVTLPPDSPTGFYRLQLP